MTKHFTKGVKQYYTFKYISHFLNNWIQRNIFVIFSKTLMKMKMWIKIPFCFILTQNLTKGFRRKTSTKTFCIYLPTIKQCCLRHLPCFRIKTNANQLQIKCQSSGASKIYIGSWVFQTFNKYNDAMWIGVPNFIMYLNFNGDVCLRIVSIPYFTYMTTIQNATVSLFYRM